MSNTNKVVPHNTREAFLLTSNHADKNSYWVTKSGQPMMIRDMSMDHLQNVVLLFEPKFGKHPLLSAMRLRIEEIQNGLKLIGADAKLRKFIREHGGYK